MRRKQVKLSLPEELVDEAEKQLQVAGSNLEEFIRLHLVAFALAKRVVGLHDTMPFGKYRGCSVEMTVRENPGYIAWLMRVSDQIRFTTPVMELLEQVACTELSELKPKPKRRGRPTTNQPHTPVH